MSVRIIHDGSFHQRGGASRTAKQLAKALDAPVSVGHSSDPAFWDDVESELLFQGEIHEGLTGRFHDVVPKPYSALRLSQRFKSVDFGEDILITTSVNSKWIVPRHDQIHVHYANAHPVHYYSKRRTTAFGWVKQSAMGVLDRHFTSMIDDFWANSELTKDRIAKHYARDAAVLHPPVRTESFYHSESEGYFVMIGRFVASKGVLTVCEAFEDLDRELYLIGDGPLEDACRELGANVITSATDSDVEDIVARSEAGIAFSRNEHCGLTPKEFQAAGKPVIVPDEPNLNNHVEHGVSGVVVEPTPEGLAAGVEELLATEWDPDRIRAETEGWSVKEFHRRCREYVEEVTDA